MTLVQGINDFKKGYQPSTNIVKDEKGDLITDSHRTLARWRNHFSQPYSVHGVSDGRQAEIHTRQPLVTEPSALEVDMAIKKLKRHKSPSTDQILAELIQAKIHKLINYIQNKEEFPEEWKELIIVPIHKGDKSL